MKSLAVVLSVAALGLVSLYPSVSEAGGQYQSAYCYKNADLSGYCYGNFQGFRNNADPSASAYFNQNLYGSRTFNAHLNNAYYSCSVNSAYPAMVDIFPQLMEMRGYFYITWDASGNCNYASWYNGSQYADY